MDYGVNLQRKVLLVRIFSSIVNILGNFSTHSCIHTPCRKITEDIYSSSNILLDRKCTFPARAFAPAKKLHCPFRCNLPNVRYKWLEMYTLETLIIKKNSIHILRDSHIENFMFSRLLNHFLAFRSSSSW